jgi:putative alpha-1,2-mannosidase
MPSALSPGLSGLLLALPILTQAQSGRDILQYVDPLIGTANGGHVFAGATLPFGMAKAVPDSVEDGQGGYATKGGKIKGFLLKGLLDLKAHHD